MLGVLDGSLGLVEKPMHYSIPERRRRRAVLSEVLFLVNGDAVLAGGRSFFSVRRPRVLCREALTFCAAAPWAAGPVLMARRASWQPACSCTGAGATGLVHVPTAALGADPPGHSLWLAALFLGALLHSIARSLWTQRRIRALARRLSRIRRGSSRRAERLIQHAGVVVVVDATLP